MNAHNPDSVDVAEVADRNNVPRYIATSISLSLSHDGQQHHPLHFDADVEGVIV